MSFYTILIPDHMTLKSNPSVKSNLHQNSTQIHHTAEKETFHPLVIEAHTLQPHDKFHSI
jgi:hypothetical protein